MTVDWTALLEQRKLSADEVKRRLPLRWVLARAGVDMEGDSGVCPFHEDTRPSLDIADLDDGYDVWNCSPCGLGGDVFTFIELRWGGREPVRGSTPPSFRATVARALELLREFERTGIPVDKLRSERTKTEEPADPMTWLETARRVWLSSDASGLAAFLEHKSVRVAAKWLHSEEGFRVSYDDFQDALFIPHFNRADEFVGYKWRSIDTKPFPVRGFKLSTAPLYGAWRDAGRDEILLCEGESDTWTCASEFPDHDVLGLPGGVQAEIQPEWLEQLAGRLVTLVLDADAAGRAGTRRWVDALEGRALGVRVAILDDDHDATSVSPAALHDAFDRAMFPKQPLGNLLAQPGFYERQGRSALQVSDFTLTPDRLIRIGDDDYAFEGVLTGGERALLRRSDLLTTRAMRDWASLHKRAWLGTDADCVNLLQLLLCQEPYIALTRATEVAGWHDDTFVLADRKIGPRELRWVSAASDVAIGVKAKIQPGPVETLRVLNDLIYLHDRAVITPLLAWVAAAPWRQRVRLFPILGVVGGSGYGKTTLLEAVLQTFGWQTRLGLGDTTPYAIYANCGATNGIPVWFDEYRPGARENSLLALGQVIRHAWDQGVAEKGGLNQGNLQKLTQLPVRAPLVVSGEDAFSETSHIERMAIVSLPRDGRNAEVLTDLHDAERTGFGYRYIEWLVEECVAPLPTERFDRREQVEAILGWGWELFSDFAIDVAHLDVGALDLSLVRESAVVENPIIELLRWGLTERDGNGPLVDRMPNGRYAVRVQALVLEARRRGLDRELALPGGTKSIKSWLKSGMNGVEVRHRDTRAVSVEWDDV